MSEPLRTWPVITLPMSRGRKRHRMRMSQSAASRMSRRLAVRCLALVGAGEDLDQFADFGVGGEVARLDRPAADAVGGLALGGEVFGLHPVVHQTGGFKGDRVDGAWHRPSFHCGG